MRVFPVVIVLLAVGAPLAAQTECGAQGYSGSAGRACQAFVDAAKQFHPLAGMIVSGGNPVLGTGETLRGVGHLSVSARFNMIKVSVPNPDSASRTSVPSSFSGLLPAPVVEGALGLIQGDRTGFLSVDALASAALLPTSGVSDLSVDLGAARVGQVALGLGYGVRVGVFHGAFGVPAVSVSIMRRQLPRLQYGVLATGDSVQFSTHLVTYNIRAVAIMRVLLLEFARGVSLVRVIFTAYVALLD